MAEKRTTLDRVIWDGSYVDMPLVKFLADMTKRLNEVPDEYREKVRLLIEYESDYYGGGSMSARAWYESPETDEEYKKRIDEERQYHEQQARQSAIRER
mgnify:CR=1 FL=1